jgi:hypothetical protein
VCNSRITKIGLSLSLGLALFAAVATSELSKSLHRDAVVGTARADQPAKSEPDATYALAGLNKSFRVAYAKARQEILRQGGPVILTSGDNVVLLRDGKRTEVRVVPENYHTLKAVAHIPLATYALLAPYDEGELSEPRLKDLQSYRSQLDGTFKALEGHLPEAMLGRQQQIIAAAQQFLDGVLERKALKHDELIAFTRKMGPLVLANAADAARAEIDALHKQVSAWKADMTPQEWNRLQVIVIGSAMPRKGNLDTQYFARLLGEAGEGPRIIYAEGLFDETRALNLLGTHRFDTDIGFAFFDDKKRMHRDLLEDGAADYLKTMKLDP